jgi:hypothetical protein
MGIMQSSSMLKQVVPVAITGLLNVARDSEEGAMTRSRKDLCHSSYRDDDIWLKCKFYGPNRSTLRLVSLSLIHIMAALS